MGRVVSQFGRVLPREVLHAHEQAAQVIAQAQGRAEALRGELDAVVEEARGRGQKEGFAAGKAQGYAEVSALLVRARLDAESTRQEAASAAVVLAVKMAEKIVGHAVVTEPRLMADIAVRALAQSRTSGGPVSLRLHPEDLAGVEQARPKLLQTLTGTLGTAAQIRLIADATILRGGCIVETALGRLDARLETQLAALEDALASRGPRGLP